MKLLSTTVGLLTLGALGLTSAHAQSKPWSLSASLRGFYDDNYATAPSNPLPGTAGAQSSFGFELSPSFGLNLSQEASALSFKYTYGMKYYEDRVNSADHSHQADLSVSHEFSPKAKISATDSFAIAQEAALLDPGISASPLRSNGNNIRNTASVLVENKVTRLLGTEVGYSNSFYDYQETGPGSRSALLDRVEHLAHLHLLWYAVPTTTVIFGYQFGVVDQTSKDLLIPGTTILPDTRDNRSHYGYVGADHYFTEQLSVHPRVGVQYTTYPNALPGVDRNRVSPYVDFKVAYAYLKNCDAQLGVKHSRTQTDIAGAAGNPTLDAETTAIYGSINHQITAKITGSLLGQYQRSEFNQGPANGLTEQLALVGVNLAYEINQFLTAEAGYNYDRLLSDVVNRTFTRNRVYIGIRAAY